MSEHYGEFRDELLAAGLLIATGVDGLFGRSASFEAIIHGIDGIAERASADLSPTAVRFPPVLSKVEFERTDYIKSFPDLIGSIHSFSGDDKKHVELLGLLEQGEDWTQALSATDVVLTPAACYPLYPMSTGTLPEGGRYYDIFNWCFRHEPSIDPCRMQAFRMHEIVCVGSRDQAEGFRDRWIEQGLSLMRELGLEVEAVVANDPFFGRVGRMLAANQRQEALKYEIVCVVANDEKPTAIMSCNCHRDHFGDPFGIRTADGEVAHSACVGFGMERIALALLRTHGVDSTAWPAGVRAALWP